MDSKRFLADGLLSKRPPATSLEIRDRLRVVDRDLKDAAVTAISIDLRFQTAYHAALELATIVLSAAGLRTTGKGHHWVTFVVLPELAGREFRERSIYFDECRNKRNVGVYDQAGRVSEAEVDELVTEARRLRTDVLAWLRRHHPKLVPR